MLGQRTMRRRRRLHRRRRCRWFARVQRQRRFAFGPRWQCRCTARCLLNPQRHIGPDFGRHVLFHCDWFRELHQLLRAWLQRQSLYGRLLERAAVQRPRFVHYRRYFSVCVHIVQRLWLDRASLRCSILPKRLQQWRVSGRPHSPVRVFLGLRWHRVRRRPVPWWLR